MKNNLEKDFEEVKKLFKEALDDCKSAEDFRLFLHSIMEIIAGDYKNIVLEKKLFKIAEKLEQEENEEVQKS